ncbi:MAG: type IV secretory system conjugative DNA transfer family protein [Defluviitaleaceae bacterium]|nr:type IV secretory system conjugative DNA transfer family protein [Defluviitaleaceae bacterium]
MLGMDIAGVLVIVIIAGLFYGLYKVIQGFTSKNDVFDYERDYKRAITKTTYRSGKEEEGVYIGTSTNKKCVCIPSNAKHVFICGTTGSGKTVAISNFIKAGVQYDYPMLIVDGKGDTGVGSLLDIVEKICPERKTYVINFNEPDASDRYNPFKNTSTDVIKDMLINMTNWSEEHYKYNTERYIQRLLKLLAMEGVELSLESLTRYLPVDNFNKLSKDLSVKELITKVERIEDSELAKISGKIAEAAAARFATIKESSLGQVFEASGIDIYTALEENAVILFILNPLLYPEMSPLIGNLIVIHKKRQ